MKSANGIPVRAISRAMAVLQTINRVGSVSMIEIANHANLPYPTAFRIVQTLMAGGFVEREPSRSQYRPTALVKTLSAGFDDDSQLVRAARPHLLSLGEKVVWPVSLATRVGLRMMIADSTFDLSPFALSKYDPGFTLPLAECASGKVYMAFCDDRERSVIREGFQQVDGPAEKLGCLILKDDQLIDTIRAQGYMAQARNSYTANPGRTSSIAVPIFAGGQLVGTLALVFFASALKPEQAVADFLPDLQTAARNIAETLEENAAVNGPLHAQLAG